MTAIYPTSKLTLLIRKQTETGVADNMPWRPVLESLYSVWLDRSGPSQLSKFRSVPGPGLRVRTVESRRPLVARDVTLRASVLGVPNPRKDVPKRIYLALITSPNLPTSEHRISFPSRGPRGGSCWRPKKQRSLSSSGRTGGRATWKRCRQLRTRKKHPVGLCAMARIGTSRNACTENFPPGISSEWTATHI